MGSGDAQRAQAQQRAEELVDRSRKAAEELLSFVRTEVSNQMQALGLDPDDLARQAAEILKLSARAGRRVAHDVKPAGGQKEAPAKKAPAKKAEGKKTAAKKGAAKKSAAKKGAAATGSKKATAKAGAAKKTAAKAGAAKKGAAKTTGAKKTAGKKTAGKKSPAKKSPGARTSEPAATR